MVGTERKWLNKQLNLLNWNEGYSFSFIFFLLLCGWEYFICSFARSTGSLGLKWFFHQISALLKTTLSDLIRLDRCRCCWHILSTCLGCVELIMTHGNKIMRKKRRKRRGKKKGTMKGFSKQFKAFDLFINWKM